MAYLLFRKARFHWDIRALDGHHPIFNTLYEKKSSDDGTSTGPTPSGRTRASLERNFAAARATLPARSTLTRLQGLYHPYPLAGPVKLTT